MEQKLRGLEKHLHRIFIAGAVFGALSCFARADYNLPLYAFLYIMWDQDMVSQPLSRYFPSFPYLQTTLHTYSNMKIICFFHLYYVLIIYHYDVYRMRNSN